MAGRVRPSGSVNVPTDEDLAQTQKAVADAIAVLTEAANDVVLILGRIHNPVQRAKAIMEVRRFTTDEVTPVTDGMFRDAVVEAYARGRAEHGWYGYGALAEELGLSRSRVQQVVNGSWKDPKAKDTNAVTSLRASADRTRTVRRLASSGVSVDEIAEQTGLSVAAVSDILNA